MARTDYDVVIVGGGFYGCCLALLLRSVTESILVVERESELLTHASRINQARVHGGYHYPRSFVTALRSQQLRARFARHFGPAIVDDAQMYYAIARRNSKVSSKRFARMFGSMDAAISPAPSSVAALFDPALIEQVFTCHESAFDWSVLRSMLHERLMAYGIEVRRPCRVERVEIRGDRIVASLSTAQSLTSRFLFNVTYAGLNDILLSSGFRPLPLKHELTELALIEPPAELVGKAVTVMDGPFFSLMPYPSRGLYSLTHVRYTPHVSWVDGPARNFDNYANARGFLRQAQSRWRHMVVDATRYMPCCAGIRYAESLFGVKTVLIRNEGDDGRPILLHCHHQGPGFYSILGGKIDNIFDLFDYMPSLDSRFRNIDDSCLLKGP